MKYECKETGKIIDVGLMEAKNLSESYKPYSEKKEKPKKEDKKEDKKKDDK